MQSLEQIKGRIEVAVPEAKIEIVPNAAGPAQSSLLLDREHAVAIAKFLRDDPALKLDHCSNVTGVDWLDRKVTKKVKVKKLVEGVEKPIVNKGYITVPDKPGLGVTLNEAVVKQHLMEPGYFEPTPQWNTDRSNDRLWS